MKSMKKIRQPINWEKYASVGTEDAEQIAIFGWCAENVGTIPELKFMFAIPNGMWTPHKPTAAKMRAMGMKRGPSDILWPIRRGDWSGLFLELKRRKTETQAAGKLSDEQDEFGKFVQSQGYGFAVCYGFEHARDTILQYYNYENKIVHADGKVLERKISEEEMKTFDTNGWR